MVTDGFVLSDLGPLGDLRLYCVKAGNEMGEQVAKQAKEVTKANELAKSANNVYSQLVQQKLDFLEASREADAEQFFAWKRDRESR
jgi:hypothetical protein